MNPQMTDWFDKYLSGKMSDDEKGEFHHTLKGNDQLKQDFETYQGLISSFQKYHQKNELENKFNEWYLNTAFSSSNKKLWWTVSYVAASVALIVTLSGLWISKSLKQETKKQEQEITFLKKEIKQIQNQQSHIVRSFQRIQQQKYAPASSQSTGFLIGPKYIITTFHSIQNADSVFVENDFHPRTQAIPIYVNRDLDLALLYVSHLNLTSHSIPILNQQVKLGNSIFTLGFPTSQLVYNEGYISAIDGYNNDSAYYQVTIPLNPGNSGGPIFDNTGKLTGVITSKNTSMEGVAFALKSTMLYALKDSLPSDSIKEVWIKAFKKISPPKNKSQIIQKSQPLIFKIYVYQKSI